MYNTVEQEMISDKSDHIHNNLKETVTLDLSVGRFESNMVINSKEWREKHHCHTATLQRIEIYKTLDVN